MDAKREMLEDLARSGLTAEDARRLDCKVLDQKGFKGARYRIPYRDLNGKINGFYRDRALDGQEPKYRQPPKTSPRLFYPALLSRKQSWPKIARDPKVRLLLTEGEKKAALLTKFARPAIGLGGIWNWSQNGRPITDFADFVWEGREVEIVPDVDTKPNNVPDAVYRLALELRRRGAIVHVVQLPAGEEKVGADDFIVASGITAFDKLPREEPVPVLRRDDPLPTARAFVAARWTDESGIVRLRYHRDTLYEWTGACWHEVPNDDLREDLYKFLEHARAYNSKGAVEPFKPTQTRVDQALDALKSAVHVSDKYHPPCWVGRRLKYAPHDLIPMQNGLLHVLTRKLLLHRPEFFNLHALDFAYDPKAPQPKRWAQFMTALWGDDKESISTLEEIFGYFLTTDARKQKIFLLVGPKRSGKSTIADVLEALCGKENTVSPTLAGLSQHFGREVLIGKTVVTIRDMRLSTNADQKAIAELLLGISGEDSKTVPRKFKPDWRGKLGARIFASSNEVPRIADASGTLASRFIVLRLTESWYGKEDLTLKDALLTELPSIFLLALEGLRRLRKRGRFMQPKSAKQEVELLEDLTSPMQVFTRQACELGAVFEISCEALYGAWRAWCRENGRDNPGTSQSFSRDLHAALPKIRTRQRRSGRYYCGLRLRGEWIQNTMEKRNVP